MTVLRAERTVCEEQKLIGNLLRDRRGFRRSIEEIERLLGSMRASADPEAFARDLHTLKGNAAVLGFATLAEHAHRLEGSIESGISSAAAQLPVLEASFRGSLPHL